MVSFQNETVTALEQIRFIGFAKNAHVMTGKRNINTQTKLRHYGHAAVSTYLRTYIYKPLKLSATIYGSWKAKLAKKD